MHAKTLLHSLVPVAAVALVVVVAAPASAKRSDETVAEHLVAPLVFDVTRNGVLVVGQPGRVTRIAPHHDPVDLVGPSDFDIAAVSVAHNEVTYGQTTLDPVDGFPIAASLMRIGRDGVAREVADLRAYDDTVNPDQVNTYGITGLSETCAATLPPFVAPAPGGNDSHPYGSVTHGSTTYVADAGGNDILAVDRSGTIRTVAVLPPTVIPVTAEAAAAFGLDPCVVAEGGMVALEPVPTDVELGPGGQLYVSTLPGGPEDGSLGANGAVYRVNPKTGAATLVASGFTSATNIAIGPRGTIYVAELFAGRVSVVAKDGSVSTFRDVPLPAGLEYAGGRLYVSQNVFGDASIVSFPAP